MVFQRLKTWFQSRHLKVDVLTAFLFVLAVAFASVIVFYNVRVNHGILQLADDLIQDVSAKNGEKVTTLIDLMKRNVELTATQLPNRDAIRYDSKKLEGFISRLLLENSAISTVSCISDQGNFVQVCRATPNQTFISDPRRPIPYGTVFGYRNVQTTPDFSETWSYRDALGLEIAKETVFNLLPMNMEYFDPNMKKMSWSNPSFNKSSGSIHLKVSLPLFDESKQYFGIANSTINLESLSEFFKSNSFSSKGFEFIFDESNTMIATNLNDADKKISELGRPLNLTDLESIPASRVIDLYKMTNIPRFLTYIDGKEWLVSFTHLPIENLNWTLLMMAPTADYLGPLLNTQNQVILVCSVVILISVLLAIYISKRISKPILQLTHEIEKIQQFDLAEPIIVDSGIREVQTISEALQGMKTSLRAFGNYLPKQLVNYLLETGESVRLGGKQRLLTIFYSDIDHFTTYTENMNPHDLMPHLSEYFDALSLVIINNKGTIDKYAGDNIMAFWNAPVENPDHASFACRAALVCERTLTRMNHKWEYEKKPTFQTRIGINTGPTIVGNIGTFDRFSYTVIGNSVTVASGLERLNKFYQTRILISDETQALIGNRFLIRPIDVVRLEGKKKAVKVFELLGEYSPIADIFPEKPQEDLCSAFSEAFKEYQEKNFAEAHRRFKAILSDFPNDYPSQLYVQRTSQFISTPPSPDWDGVTDIQTSESISK